MLPRLRLTSRGNIASAVWNFERCLYATICESRATDRLCSLTVSANLPIITMGLPSPLCRLTIVIRSSSRLPIETVIRATGLCVSNHIRF
jgi:hypothetical protein